jgi:hypothetical protein
MTGDFCQCHGEGTQPSSNFKNAWMLFDACEPRNASNCICIDNKVLSQCAFGAKTCTI